MLMLDPDFWRGKNVFLTGHTGFKGTWLSIWLASLGANVKGYALQPESSPNLFTEASVDTLIDSQFDDIRKLDRLKQSMKGFNPDIVIHLAAQSIVRLSYQEPIQTYEVNIIGTANVLEAARDCSNLKSIVNITSDKCYENYEHKQAFKEIEPMGGYDPYSSSKGCAELITSAYRRSFLKTQGIGLASARAGNVIGGGDWAQDRLLPDILKAFTNNQTVVIRNPDAIRPWQHVLEPLHGYLLLAEKLYKNTEKFAQAWNFGPHQEDVKSVKWVVEKMTTKWPGASWSVSTKNHPHEAKLLMLDISKAATELSWSPKLNLDVALNNIISWHQHWINGSNVLKVIETEISQYMRS